MTFDPKSWPRSVYDPQKTRGGDFLLSNRSQVHFQRVKNWKIAAKNLKEVRKLGS